MLTDYDTSLACKCVFYRSAYNAKGDLHGTEF